MLPLPRAILEALTRTPPASVAQDGKIHYMEDTHQANHNGKEEERICMDFVAQGRVSFVG